jgi:serine/threonine-protein kinase
MDDSLERLSAALAGRYTIESRAGQGGMATVYRAMDQKHHRLVAIKVLRPELSATVGSERFLREIDMSARLQHPHIVPVYDSGDANGVLYYVMPFVEGESLRDRLTREGKLPFEEAVRLNGEVASALAYAHAHGIIHRDIKPENIMLSGGHAVVTDFGIARALSAATDGGPQLTGLGLAIGTPAYMSPEQATASEVDARSDQYSLACVFYEMATGQAPFRGAQVQAVITQSLTGPRPRVSRVNRETPQEADAPVQRAMAADPAARYATVQEFAAALEKIAGGGAGAVEERRRLKQLVIGLPLGVALLALGWILFGPRRSGPVMQGAESIAVLPFTASGQGVDLMGEGMVDLLTTNLNSVGGIRAVDPRTVMTRVKKAGATSGIDLQTGLSIGRDVKAQAVVLGSIVATGNAVRISADLYGQDGKSLAHAQVDGAADSVLPLVDGLSRELVREIWRSKEPVPSLRVSGLTTGSLTAMRDYLTGEQFYRRAEWDSAAAAFGAAVEQDSTFALAQYRLAMALGWKGGYALPQARAASEAALRFATRLPPRERALVTAYQLFSYGRTAAVDSMRKYVAAWPDDIEGWNLLGETQYHTRERNGLDAATLEQPFDKVIAADSSLTPPIIHPMELALATRDSVKFSRYLALFRTGATPEEYEAFKAAGDLVWGGVQPDSQGIRHLASHGGALMATFTAAQVDPATGSDMVLDRYGIVAKTAIVAQPTDQNRLQTLAGRGMLLTSLGRFAEARRLADSIGPATQQTAGAIYVFPVVLGIAPPHFADSTIALISKIPINSPFLGFVVAESYLGHGDVARGGRIIDSLLASDTTKYPDFLRGALVAGQGWKRMAAGDTAGGIVQMRRGIEALGNQGGPVLNGAVRLQFALGLASQAATRDEGIRLLENGFDNDLGLLPLTFLALGRAYEAAGNRPAAAVAYSQFLRLWDKADSTVQGRVQQAKDGLVRVTGEPKN